MKQQENHKQHDDKTALNTTEETTTKLKGEIVTTLTEIQQEQHGNNTEQQGQETTTKIKTTRTAATKWDTNNSEWEDMKEYLKKIKKDRDSKLNGKILNLNQESGQNSTSLASRTSSTSLPDTASGEHSKNQTKYSDKGKNTEPPWE